MIAFALLLVAFAGQARAYPLTPDNVAGELQRRDPRVVITELDKSGRYEKILDFIGKGNEEWIKIAPLLEKGADASAGETLTISLAQGLVANPQGVLSVAKSGPASDGSTLSIAEVCSAPFIEPSKKMLTAYFKRAIKAVSGVNDSELTDKKAECLKALQAAKAIPFTQE